MFQNSQNQLMNFSPGLIDSDNFLFLKFCRVVSLLEMVVSDGASFSRKVYQLDILRMSFTI